MYRLIGIFSLQNIKNIDYSIRTSLSTLVLRVYDSSDIWVGN
jgi:hypothetical protein